MAVRRLSGLPDEIARRRDGLDRADVSFILGGLAPVPLLFLLGVIVDDESRTLMDWDGKRHVWRRLDEEDDRKRFAISGLEVVTKGTTRAASAKSSNGEPTAMTSQSSQFGSPTTQRSAAPATVLLTPKEAAKVMKVSLSWLAKARMRGDGPSYIKLGRSIRYTEASLQQWMKSRQRLSTSEH